MLLWNNFLTFTLAIVTLFTFLRFYVYLDFRNVYVLQLLQIYANLVVLAAFYQQLELHVR